jgi:hypothetical protein
MFHKEEAKTILLGVALHQLYFTVWQINWRSLVKKDCSNCRIFVIDYYPTIFLGIQTGY